MFSLKFLFLIFVCSAPLAPSTFHLKNELRSTGVLEEKYIRDVLDDDYFSSITEGMNTTWKTGHNGTSVKQSFDDFLVENMGKPMSKLLRLVYLVFEQENGQQDSLVTVQFGA